MLSTDEAPIVPKPNPPLTCDLMSKSPNRLVRTNANQNNNTREILVK